MLKEEKNDGFEGGGNTNSWARICDTCRSAPCTVYCRADCAFLCTGCDTRIHAVNRVASRHKRVWVCEACERAPAAFLCKADAASLCITCDSDIHSANPLARRHHRVPILPIAGTLYGPQAIGHVRDVEDDFLNTEPNETIDEDDEDEAASWLLLNPVKNNNQSSNNNGILFGSGDHCIDKYLDLDEYNSDQQNHFSEQFNNQHQLFHKGNGNESGVTVESGGDADKQVQQQQQHYHNFQLGIDYESSNTEYGYPASFNHTISISSLDVGVVPESTMSDVSISHPRPPKGTIDLFSGPAIQMPSQLTPSDREARVLRYREKKKARKFEKTIRYASRKAYAETRPRIKGRFAKRTDVEVEVDQIFSSPLMAESGYGVVPTF